MSHIGCSSHVKYQDANCFSFSEASHWPSPSSWLVPIQNSQVGGTVISAIFSSSFCFIFCSWIFPLSLLVLLMIDSFLLFSFLCVCAFYPPVLPNVFFLPFSFCFFLLLSFPFKIYYIFFFLVAFPCFTFFLDFALSFP